MWRLRVPIQYIYIHRCSYTLPSKLAFRNTVERLNRYRRRRNTKSSIRSGRISLFATILYPFTYRRFTLNIISIKYFLGPLPRSIRRRRIISLTSILPILGYQLTYYYYVLLLLRLLRGHWGPSLSWANASPFCITISAGFLTVLFIRLCFGLFQLDLPIRTASVKPLDPSPYVTHPLTSCVSQNCYNGQNPLYNCRNSVLPLRYCSYAFIYIYLLLV